MGYCTFWMMTMMLACLLCDIGLKETIALSCQLMPTTITKMLVWYLGWPRTCSKWTSRQMHVSKFKPKAHRVYQNILSVFCLNTLENKQVQEDISTKLHLSHQSGSFIFTFVICSTWSLKFTTNVSTLFISFFHGQLEPRKFVDSVSDLDSIALKIMRGSEHL